MAEPPVTFAGLLRRLRTQARLTQEELAEAAGLSPRSVSDLERGIAATPRRETVRLLADALGLAGQTRAEFEAVARGRPVPAGPATDGAAAMRTLPRDIASFTGRQQELQELVEAAAGAGGTRTSLTARSTTWRSRNQRRCPSLPPASAATTFRKRFLEGKDAGGNSAAFALPDGASGGAGRRDS